MAEEQAPRMTKYAVRKASGRHDYITRWCVVRIENGQARRVKYSTDTDRESVQAHADQLNGVPETTAD